MADSELQRKNMVESQVRPSDVTDRRITAAMTAIPRERFVPSDLISLAYSDDSLPVTKDGVMLAPRVLAKLVQLADATAGDKAIVIGVAPGYTAALLAEMGCHVTALVGTDGAAADLAKTLKSLNISNVTPVSGALADGAPSAGLFDVIVIEGGIEQVPAAIAGQLADRGRLVAIDIEHRIGKAIRVEKTKDVLSFRDAFQASAPLLRGFAVQHPAFVF